MSNNSIKWATKQRLQYIELMAFYTGVVTRSDVVKAFGISDAAATKDLNLYGQLCPDNLIYKHSVFGFVPSESFSEVYADLSPQAALPMTAANLAVLSGPYGDNLIYGIPSATLPLPSRMPDKTVLAQITRAIKNKKKLRAAYSSLSDKENTEKRIIEPHSLVNTGIRWHVRAYNEDSYDFRDFVLSRFLEAQITDEDAESSMDYDDDWVESVTIVLRPHPKLDDKKQQSLNHDYGAKEGKIILKIRRSLVGYLLQQLSVDTTSDSSLNPKIYQLILTNREDIEPFAGWAFQ